MPPAPPVALTIAGSDCCAGAGLQADLKTFALFGVHGLSAVTSVVAETPRSVHGIYPVDPPALQEQLHILLESYPVAAIKTGMLGSAPHIVAVAEILEDAGLPLVVDPVLISSSGDALASSDSVHAYRKRLLPLATVATPNFSELRALLHTSSPRDEFDPADEEFVGTLMEDLPCSVLVTGGHDEQNTNAVDRLWHEGALLRFSSPRVEIADTHGTGCTLSAAVAAGLAHGNSLPDAVAGAKRLIDRALAESYSWIDDKGGELRALNQLPERQF